MIVIAKDVINVIAERINPYVCFENHRNNNFKWLELFKNSNEMRWRRHINPHPGDSKHSKNSRAFFSIFA